MSRYWIVDGHNVIFAIPQLRRLQDAGQGEEARQGLIDALRRFTQGRQHHLLVVFDGGDERGDETGTRGTLLEVVYSRRRPGGADEEIIRKARSLLEEGHSVSVVTNDVTTLAVALPKAADHLKVQPFWEKYVDAPGGEASKPVEGDFSDLECEMLALTVAEEPVRVGTKPATPGKLKDPLRERLRLKKEKGRARHQRRFRRR